MKKCSDCKNELCESDFDCVNKNATKVYYYSQCKKCRMIRVKKHKKKCSVCNKEYLGKKNSKVCGTGCLYEKTSHVMKAAYQCNSHPDWEEY